VLINLLPDFLDILAQSDPEAAYHRFMRTALAAYWSATSSIWIVRMLEVIAGALRGPQ
jgi:hypothetical protein